MRIVNHKRRVSRVAALLAAGSVALPLLNTPAAQADPKQYTAMVAMGSDTTQAVLNALAGESNGTVYTPIQATDSTKRQIASWDAVGTSCISPKAPGATITRPIGSTNGRRALSRAIDGTRWGQLTCGGATVSGEGSGKYVSGLVDFARSSSGPTSGDTGTDLTYIPFGRDAVTFAYYAPAGVTPVTSLSKAQLVSIFSSSTRQVINGTEIIPCGIQTGSGTHQFWLGSSTLNISGTNENTATTECNNAAPAGRIEEHDSVALRAKGNSFAGKQIIVGMGAGPYISQWNGVAPDRTDIDVKLGEISDNGSGTALGIPYNGATPTAIPAGLSPRNTFYNDATFGRDIYNVFDTAKLGPPAAANQDIKSMFVGAGSVICSAAAQARVSTFGFLTPSNCGSTALTGSLISGS